MLFCVCLHCVRKIIVLLCHLQFCFVRKYFRFNCAFPFFKVLSAVKSSCRLHWYLIVVYVFEATVSLFVANLLYISVLHCRSQEGCRFYSHDYFGICWLRFIRLNSFALLFDVNCEDSWMNPATSPHILWNLNVYLFNFSFVHVLVRIISE